MKQLSDGASLRAWRDSLDPDQSVGFVPTMGALHKAHGTLFTTARPDCDQLLASVFINPLQFERADDLKAYPRTLEEDLTLLERLGVDAVYLPTPEDMYEFGFSTKVQPGPVGDLFEGAARPGHFEGVLTVVLKLFQRSRPQAAYFGQKDAQQLFLVRRMVRDLDLPLDIVPCPTLREDDGLAFSSRNARLSSNAREQALVLFRSLRTTAEAFEEGERNPRALARLLRSCFEGSEAELAYAEVIRDDTFEAAEAVPGVPWRAIVAARLEGVHLLDNLMLGTS